MKKLFYKCLSIMISLFMVLSGTAVFAAPAGVTGLAAKRSSNTLTLSWVNPTDEGFRYNEVYKTFDGETALIATLEDGETSVTTDVTAGGHYLFMVKSVYEDGSSAQTELNFLRTWQDTEAFEGWKLDVRDESHDNDAFRGEYGISYTEAHSGISSAYFKIDHNREANVYLQLFQDNVSMIAGKNYCLSFWFKTAGYGSEMPGGGNYRSQIKYLDPITGSQVGVEIDENYPNGEWHNYKTYFSYPIGDYNSGSYTKFIGFIIDCYGELWLDDIEIYEVDENKERVYESDALEKSGTFEAERGVTNLSVKRSGNNAVMTWTNPSNYDFERNEIYVKTPGEEAKLLAVLSGGEESYTYEGGVADPNSYLFTVRSYYSDSGISVDNEAAVFRGGADKSTFTGWQADTQERRDTLFFRGYYEISSEEAYEGEASAHFYVSHKPENAVYFQIWRDVRLEAGEEYIYSFMFKTKNNLSANGSRFEFFDPSADKGVKYAVDTDYTDGEWTKKEITFTSAKDGNKRFYFTFDAYGDIYIDDVKVIRVSDGVNLLEADGVNYGGFEGSAGVSDFTYKSNDPSTISLSWKNPTDAGFEKNELYLVTNDGRELIAELTDGETSYEYTGAEAGARYDFVMVSYFGEREKEAALTAYAKRLNSTAELAPGWIIDYRDTNPERYRGKVGVSTSDAHSGKTALFFMMEEPMQAFVYNKLYRQVNLEEGKTYEFSGWIKTEGYGEGATRFKVNVAGTEYAYVMDLSNKQITDPISGENSYFDNGEWYKFTIYYTADKTAAKEFSLTMDSKGTIYADDLEVYQVEEFGGEYDIVSENLIAASEGKTGGDFEYELVAALNVNADGDTAEAQAYIGNCFLMDAESKILIAVYDENNRLKYIEEKAWSECAPADDKEYTPYEGNMTVSAPYRDGYSVKAFVWDGMLPLCESGQY